MSDTLYHNVKATIAIAPASGVAGTSDINGATLDMAGFDGVMAIVTFGTITGGAVTSIKWQQDSASGMGTAADLAGTSVTVADTDDEKVKIMDLRNPLERYVRIVVDRGTQNAVVASAVYLQYAAKAMPVTHATGVAGESHVSPAEGTA